MPRSWMQYWSQPSHNNCRLIHCRFSFKLRTGSYEGSTAVSIPKGSIGAIRCPIAGQGRNLKHWLYRITKVNRGWKSYLRRKQINLKGDTECKNWWREAKWGREAFQMAFHIVRAANAKERRLDVDNISKKDLQDMFTGGTIWLSCSRIVLISYQA